MPALEPLADARGGKRTKGKISNEDWEELRGNLVRSARTIEKGERK